MISVIIPAYNCENTLEKAVESVLAQTYRDFELIIVNDGSTDGTERIARQMEQKDKRVKVITTDNNGAGKARNRGMDDAAGEYLCFVDSDDWVEPEYLKALLDQVGDGNLPCIGVSKNGSGVSMMTELPGHRWQIDEKIADDLLMGDLRKGILYSVCNKLFKVSVLRKHSIRFYEGYPVGEDLLFTLRYICFCRSVSVDPGTLYAYYFHSSSVTHSAKNNLIPWDDQLLEKLIIFEENGYTISDDTLHRYSFEKIIGRICNGYPASLSFREFQDYCRRTVFSSLLYRYAMRDDSKVGFQRGVFRYALKKKNLFLLRLLIKGKAGMRNA